MGRSYLFYNEFSSHFQNKFCSLACCQSIKKIWIRKDTVFIFLFLMLMTLLDAIVASINLSSYSTHLNKVISFSYFVSYNIGVPVWIVNLMGLALLVMNQVIRDSQKC